jgi:hypothetical protein
MHFFPGRTEEDGNQLSLSVKLVCYHEEKFIHAWAPSVSHVVAVIALPEACSATASQQDFETFVRELRPYWDQMAETNL